jgi:hypothetical protein
VTITGLTKYWGDNIKKYMGGIRNTYKVLVGTSENKRLLWRSGHRWNANITINLKKQDLRV